MIIYTKLILLDLLIPRRTLICFHKVQLRRSESVYSYYYVKYQKKLGSHHPDLPDSHLHLNKSDIAGGLVINFVFKIRKFKTDINQYEIEDPINKCRMKK